MRCVESQGGLLQAGGGACHAASVQHTDTHTHTHTHTRTHTLPPTAVGVMTRDGKHLLVDSGPLPEAVAASAAIPWLFQAVDIPGAALRTCCVAERLLATPPADEEVEGKAGCLVSWRMFTGGPLQGACWFNARAHA